LIEGSLLKVYKDVQSATPYNLNFSLSLQQLLNETVLFRCRERLMEAQKLLEQSKPKITGIIYVGSFTKKEIT
jgi:hypothetical protein